MRSLSVVWQRDPRRVWILLLTAGLHVVVLYAVLQETGRLSIHAALSDTDRVDLYFFKPVRKIEPIDHPKTKESASQSSATPRLHRTEPEVKPISPAIEAPPAPAETVTPQPGDAHKSLDVAEILKGVGPDVAKYDREHPGEKNLPGERLPPSLQARLDRIFAEGTPPPKWYEGARVEEISSGAQLDAGIRMYKVTTFALSYCVTYRPDMQPVKSLCPIKF